MLAWLEIEYQILQKVYVTQLEAQEWNEKMKTKKKTTSLLIGFGKIVEAQEPTKRR